MTGMDDPYGEIEELELAKYDLEAQVAALDGENTALRLDVEDLSREVTDLRKENENLRDMMDALLVRLQMGVA